MASKARHIADMIAVGARGESVGSTSVKIKTTKSVGKTDTGWRFGADDTDDLFIANTSSDKVGIQTGNPTKTLDVNGDVRIRSGLYDSSERVFKVYYANNTVAWG